MKVMKINPAVLAGPTATFTGAVGVTPTFTQDCAIPIQPLSDQQVQSDLTNATPAGDLAPVIKGDKVAGTE